MFNTPYPYLQASGKQLVDMLETLVDVYANVAVLIAAMLLVLLIWLCIAELRQSPRPRRAASARPSRPSGSRRARERRLLEESSI